NGWQFCQPARTWNVCVLMPQTCVCGISPPLGCNFCVQNLHLQFYTVCVFFACTKLKGAKLLSIKKIYVLHVLQKIKFE
ncbi:MAG: hypothetical protein RR140_03615, partial [Clostridia bacterium]